MLSIQALCPTYLCLKGCRQLLSSSCSLVYCLSYIVAYKKSNEFHEIFVSVREVRGMEAIMKEVIHKSKCTGCSACMNICPKKAINMNKQSDGFAYSTIDQKKCIDCSLCIKTCPVISDTRNDSINKCYVGYTKEDYYKDKSSSGGLFPLIADYILDNNGIVIGALFEGNKLLHKAITKKEDLNSLKGSKYLQSDLNNIFTYKR